MSTTMLERTNPLNELHAAPLATPPGLVRRTLHDLDDEVTEIFEGLDFAPLSPIAPVPVKRPGLLRRLRPQPRPEPRQHKYPVTWNLPKPERMVRPHISVQQVPRPGPARPAEMPRSLTWLPMLRGAVNAALDAGWQAWLGSWDRTMMLSRLLGRASAELALQKFKVQEMELAAKTARTVDYFTRAAWEDYLGVFGAVEGTAAAHIADRLAKLGALAA